MTSPSEAPAGSPLRSVLVAVAALLALPAAAPPELPAASLQQASGDQDTYTVRQGDTLWGIARRLLGDPGRWREIRRLNEEALERADLLRPGQTLRIPAGEAPGGGRESGARGDSGEDRDRPEAGPPPRGEREAREDTIVSEPPARGDDALPGRSLFERSERSVSLGAPRFRAESETAPTRVSSSDRFGSPFLAGSPDEEAAGVTLGPAQPGRRRLSQNLDLSDQVLLALGEVRASPGDTLEAVHWARRVGGRGRIARPVALLTVDAVSGDTATATVRRLFGLYRSGDPVLSVRPGRRPGRGRELVSVEDGMRTRVVAVERGSGIVAPGERIFLGAGRADGVRVGDEFRVYAPPADSRGPRGRVAAVVRVVRLRRSSATGRVVEVRGGILLPGSAALRVRRPARPGG